MVVVIVVMESAGSSTSTAATGSRLVAAAIRLRLDATAVGARTLPQLPRHDDVPVILHGVVSAAGKQTRDHRPLVAVEAVRGEQPLLFFLREWAPIDSRVQLIEPP